MKKGISYRITKRGNEFVVESKSIKVDWRKKNSVKSMKEAIEFIEYL